jgi:hypothetical protein
MTKEKCQSVSDQHYVSQSDAPGDREESLLSPRRAFVVQFREETEGAQSHFTGRVEHMVSGHATRFHSPEELLAFFAQVLSPTRTKPP